MKIQINSNTRLAGGAMLAVAIFAVVVASTLAAYLLLVQGEYTNAARSQSWNSSMVTSEAGIEDAMGLINQFEAAGNFSLVTNWSDPSNLSGNWTALGGNLYTNSRIIMNGTVIIGECHVIIDNNPVIIITNLPGNYRTNTCPIINAMGVGAWMGSTASGPAPMFAQAGLSAAAPRRAVQIQTTIGILFKGAMTTVDQVTMNGNGIMVDSFDSTDPAHSVWNTNFGYGTYVPAQAATIQKANGNVYTDGSVVDAGGANIYGHADTGPGGLVSIQQNTGLVGPLGTPSGTKAPGWTADDMNVTFPAVSLPTTLGSPTVFAGTTISAPGFYQINSIGNSVFNIQGSSPAAPINVTIYLPTGFSLQKAFNITNATVTIYTGGDLSTSGNGVINNTTQNSLNLGIYGLPPGYSLPAGYSGSPGPGCKNISFSGNAAFTGTIYAPSADFSFAGGGSGAYDFVGSVTAKTATLSGGAQFHFDENLLRSGPASGYIPKYWKEVSAY